MSSKLLLVNADICFSAALAFSFFDVDLDLIFSPKDEALLGVTVPASEEEEEDGATFGVDGRITGAGWILGEGGVGWEPPELFRAIGAEALPLLLFNRC